MAFQADKQLCALSESAYAGWIVHVVTQAWLHVHRYHQIMLRNHSHLKQNKSGTAIEKRITCEAQI